MRNYPAKLLLFGEHVLLLGASALAVPVPAFAGKWTRENAGPGKDRHLQSLLQFADSKELREISGLDTEALKQDLSSGWHFASNIPEGYGMGSSGALCAGMYDRYGREKTEDLSALKNIFARMESYFHGSSSGIDPLTSYLTRPLLIREKTEVSGVEIPVWSEKPVVFLLDTRLQRQTGPLVQWFLEQSRQTVFAEWLATEFLPKHEAMVKAWLQADAAAFRLHLRRVSQFQLDRFHPMIPAHLHEIWKKSLNSDDFNLKICGAGGGGFVLGFAKERAIVEKILSEYPLLFPFENATLS